MVLGVETTTRTRSVEEKVKDFCNALEGRGKVLVSPDPSRRVSVHPHSRTTSLPQVCTGRKDKQGGLRTKSGRNVRPLLLVGGSLGSGIVSGVEGLSCRFFRVSGVVQSGPSYE